MIYVSTVFNQSCNYLDWSFIPHSFNDCCRSLLVFMIQIESSQRQQVVDNNRIDPVGIGHKGNQNICARCFRNALSWLLALLVDLEKLLPEVVDASQH